MNRKVFWLSIIGILVSFAGGFLLANALNRKELDTLKAEIGRLKNSSQPDAQNNSEQTLSDDEIRQKLAEADTNPENIEFQKGLAMALYRYAGMKQEPRWMRDVARLLNRVHEKNPRDYNTLISLGNIYFDISQDIAHTDLIETKDDANKNIRKARDFYLKALEIKPDDADVRTDLGLTDLYANPPDNNQAVSEFQKSLQANPKGERALENIIRAYLNIGNIKQAEWFLIKLKEVNPNNEALKELSSALAEKKNSK